MAIIKIKVSETPKVGNIQDFLVLGLDRSTNDNAHADMEQLRGNVGPAPEITIIVNELPYGSTPTVDKTGTDVAPIYTIGFPLAKDGDKPLLRKTDDYIQYRYNESEEWQNLIALSELKLNYSDLTPEDIAELQRPATEAAATANTAAENANTQANSAQAAATNANEKATLAEQNAAIAATATENANNATANANAATESANTAISNANAATQSAIEATNNANIATTDANNAANYANEVAADTEELNEHPPVIITGTWHVWSTQDNEYKDTGITAQGRALIVLPNGNYGNWDDATGQYLDSGVAASASIDLETVPVNFTEAAERSNIVSGETVPQAFGKILKMQNDLGTLAYQNSVDYLTQVENTPEFVDVITDASYSADGTTVTVTFSRYNASTSSVSEITRFFPVVSDTASGAMTSEAYNTLIQVRDDVQTLKERGGRFIGVSFATKADLDAYVIPPTVNPGDFTYVLTDETQDNATTQYIATGTAGSLVFEFAYIVNYAPIGIATLEIAGIVKSSEAAGKSFVEADGTMSVMGWDALNNRVGSLEKPNGTNNLINSSTQIDPIYLPNIEADSFQVNETRRFLRNYTFEDPKYLLADGSRVDGTLYPDLLLPNSFSVENITAYSYSTYIPFSSNAGGNIYIAYQGTGLNFGARISNDEGQTWQNAQFLGTPTFSAPFSVTNIRFAHSNSLGWVCFVVISNRTYIYQSTDGLQFQFVYQVNRGYNDISMSDNMCLLVGPSMYILLSSNLTDWSESRIESFTFSLNACTYGAGNFVVYTNRNVQGSQAIYYSTDGVNWNSFSSGISVNTSYQITSLEYALGKFILRHSGNIWYFDIGSPVVSLYTNANPVILSVNENYVGWWDVSGNRYYYTNDFQTTQNGNLSGNGSNSGIGFYINNNAVPTGIYYIQQEVYTRYDIYARKLVMYKQLPNLVTNSENVYVKALR